MFTKKWLSYNEREDKKKLQACVKRDLLNNFSCARGYLYLLGFQDSRSYFELISLPSFYFINGLKTCNALLNLFDFSLIFNKMRILFFKLFIVRTWIKCIFKILSAAKNGHYKRSTAKLFWNGKIANFKQSLHFFVT